jgi:hypothetical protein
MKEGDKEFADRVERAYRFNHTKEVVELLNKYLFKGDIVRNKESAPAEIAEFWEDTTKSKDNIVTFMKEVSRETSITGRLWIVVDTTKVAPVSEDELEPMSVKDEKELGISQYAYIVLPEDMLDLAYDEGGEISWALIRELNRDDADPFTSSGNVEERFRLWTKTEWRLFGKQKGGKQDGTIVELDSGINEIGVVPVVPADHFENSQPYCANGLIDDIAYLDRAVANYLSNLDAIIQDQTFSQLAMPAQAQLASGDDAQSLVDMGTKRIFTFDGEGGGKPEYLSPDVKQAQLIVTTVKQIINEIYHSVGMAGERTKQDNALGIDNSSGVAKAYDFERIDALLASKAAALRVAEAKMLQIFMRYRGKTIELDDLLELIVYPDTFDARGLADEFEVALNLSALNAPEEMLKEQMRTISKKTFPRMSDQEEKAMEASIKSWKPLSALTPAFGAAPKSESKQGQNNKE